MRHPLRRLHSQNYLRVRGEYCCKLFCMFSHAELPPRARRIHYSQLLVKSKAGTTSACAENTLLRWLIPYCVVELPPRARRIRRTSLLGVASVGTTSACAENTSRLSVLSSFSRNYLRVRGEYDSSLDIFAFPLELPPRARRIPATTGPGVGHTGTTSACAENTAFSDSPSP